MKTTRKNKGLYTIQFIILSLLMSVIIISCGGCKGSKVVMQTDSKGQTVDSSVSINVQQIPNQEKEVYFFQDHPVLAKLKLTREPKAEIIIEDPQNGERVISHMFDENGKYLGVFDYKAWEKKDKTDEFFKKNAIGVRENVIDLATSLNRKLIWEELKRLGFGITEKDFNKANFIYGYGLRIEVPVFFGQIKYLVGSRNIRMMDMSEEGEFDKYWHETYLFDYSGKLLKIFNYDEMGEYLQIYMNGKIGISKYITGWDEEWEELYQRYHDFERNKYYDIKYKEIIIKIGLPSNGTREFLDLNENYIFEIYTIYNEKTGRNDKLMVLVFDLKSDLVFYKYFEMKTKPVMEWKFFTKPDGIKIDLSEFNSLKYK